MAKKLIKYVGDFETTTDPADCRVWASCLVDIETNETKHLSNNIEGMFEFLKDKNSEVFFANLKFDGEFIISYLLNNGYEHILPDPSERARPRPKAFTTLITDGGVFYTITVWFACKNKQYEKVTFYDSLKKLPMSVSKIAKAFNLDMRKLVIDYDEYREPGHVLTELEKEYIEADCKIVAAALKEQFAEGLTNMTNASDAMNGYKGFITKNMFERWFPVLPVEIDDDLRRTYKGGFTYVNPKYQGRLLHDGITLDINSLYPSRMYDCVLPYGYPVYFECEIPDEPPEPLDGYPLFMVKMRGDFELKAGHIPCLQLKKNRYYAQTEYLSSSKVKNADGSMVYARPEFWLTSVDLALFLDHYDTINMEYLCGWRFKGATGMFKAYIDYWMHIKETTTGGRRQLAKLMLNGLYGKFASNPHSKKKTPYLDEDGIVKYEFTEEELREPVYTAMGAFITAYARDKTIRSAQSVYDRFIYADTDSLHLVGTDIPEDLDIHPTKLGAWKHEGTWLSATFIRCKTYIETMDELSKDCLENYAKILNKTHEAWRESDGIRWNNMIVTCAGMPDNVKESVTYENFHIGSVFEGKLMPVRVKGGVILQERNFTIQ